MRRLKLFFYWGTIVICVPLIALCAVSFTLKHLDITGVACGLWIASEAIKSIEKLKK